MYYSIVTAENVKRTLAVLAIFALVFGPFSNVLVANAHTNDQHEQGDHDDHTHIDNPSVSVCRANSAPSYYWPQYIDARTIVTPPNGYNFHNTEGLDNKGDILPAFTYDLGHGRMSFPGKNLTTVFSNGKTGAQILANKCVVVPAIDMCPNIEGAQAAVPEGKQVDNSGNCVDIPPPPVDVCTNLDGVQTEVPSGYTADGSVCTPVVPPTDLCPNIDGDQTTIPDGKQVDNSGNCVDIPPPPVDVCTNLDGVQTEVPSGYTADGSVCTLIPPPVDMCPNIEGNQASVPEGDIVNNDGQCVPDVTPTDLCPNIEGTQTEIPTGDIVNSDGQCAPAPTPVCKVGNNLLTNASFEDPVVEGNGNWSIFNSVVGWTISLSDGLEIWHNLFGTASEGQQNAELDGNAPTKITQTVATIPGATYELKFDFTARPGTGIADNNVDALVNGSAIMNATADGSAIATNTWSTHSQTFVATGTSTEVGFEDKGTANSYGSAIDNTAVCLVSVPEPVKACSVNVVSDVTNTVTENENANAVLTWVHPVWLASIASSSAAWIWGSAEEQNPTQTETETFVKKFTWNGPATTAVLKIATDNSYVVKLNGTQVAADPTENNFSSADTVDVAANIVTGENTLEIAVTNMGVAGAGAHDNPAGLLYDLTVVGNTETDCTKVTDTNGGGSHDTYKLYGTVWNDTDKDNLIDEGEADLSGFTVRAVNASNTEQVFTTESDASGHYELNVPAGTWIISELTPEGWVLLSSGDGVNGTGTYTVTVPTPVVMTLMDWIIPTAEAAAVNPSFGPYNFGNIPATTTDNTSTTRHHHGSSHSNNGGGQVLGDSTSKPAPEGEVLGASTSTMPVGAPNTGAGGTSSMTELPIINAILATRVTGRKAK
jgi:hypothetical protein